MGEIGTAALSLDGKERVKPRKVLTHAFSGVVNNRAGIDV
jgi:hypothetical protein